MKAKLCFLLLATAATVGCYVKARLYPVQGPLSAQTPVPVLMAKLTGKINPESITIVLNDGETCKGRWIFVNHVSSNSSKPVTAPSTDLSGAWDSIYGPNYYTSHIVGARYYAQAVARGNRGSVLNVELNGFDKGVAKDDKGNIYKLVLQQ